MVSMGIFLTMGPYTMGSIEYIPLLIWDAKLWEVWVYSLLWVM